MEKEHIFKDIDPNLIQLPESTYPLQKRMVRLIVQAISKKKSLVIQSPTGTGKTMCLLSATLEAVKQRGIQRVYYLTRTHTQMNGIIAEIRKTCYKPNFVVLQSRKALCVHKPAVEKGRSLDIEQFNELCDQAKKTTEEARQIVEYCPLLRKIDEKMDKTLTFPPAESIRNQNDIKLHAKSQGICPQKYESHLAPKAQLVIMSYIYLINSFIFRNKNFDLSNSVILFDEAHNVLDIARNQSSTILNIKTIENSLQEISLLRTSTQREILQNPQAKDLLTKAETIGILDDYHSQMVSLVKSIKKYFQSKCGASKLLILSIDQLKQATNISLQGFISFRLMKKDTLSQLAWDIKKMNKSKKTVRSYLNSFISMCYKLEEILNEEKYNSEFVCALFEEKREKGTQFKVKFHCMTSKIVFDRLTTPSTSIVFASGTLNPEDFKETGLTFLNHFCPLYPQQNPYPNGNVERFSIETYDSRGLEINYRNPNYDLVTQLLQEAVRPIPNGILVFFKSYSYLMQFKSHIVENYIDFGKKVFFEERVMADFQETINTFKQEARTNGAILFGCMRGKASEGCNFEDEFARAVFIVGIPYASINSIEAEIHKHIGDYWHWLEKDALLAVNQAIGRVVRHRNDFGLVFLVGKAFSKHTKRLPKWLTLSNSHKILGKSMLHQHISNFFRNKGVESIRHDEEMSLMNDLEIGDFEELEELWKNTYDSDSEEDSSKLIPTPVNPRPPLHSPLAPTSGMSAVQSPPHLVAQTISSDSDEQQETRLLAALQESMRHK